MKNKLRIEKERRINAPAKTVWDIITETPTDWEGITIEIRTDWKVGSDITFAFNWDGKNFEDKGKILEFEEGKVFAYTYWSAFSGLPDSPENRSKVKYQLISDGERTILKLLHTNFAKQKMYEDSNANWESTLDTIKQRAEKK